VGKLRRAVLASILLTVAWLGGQHLVPAQAAQGAPAAGLVGTWRLVEFWDRETPTSPFVYRYGRTPTGYFTYDATGRVSIQIMRGPDHFRVDSARGEQWFAQATVEELRRATEDYRAYFGTYTVDAVNGVVVHRVEGDSRGLYTGTDQRRTFRLAGDTLTIGDGSTTHRVLVRVR
jgi:hypothetical protein